MIVFLITALVLFGLLVVFVMARGSQYKAIFSNAHLVEMAEGLRNVKAAALARIEPEDSSAPIASDDPRVLRTRADIAVIYTIAYRDPDFVHHCSLSIAGRLTPHAVGEPFTVYIAKRLGLDLARLQCLVSESNVFHAEGVLTPDEEVEFARRALEPLSEEAARQLYSECMTLSRETRFEPMDTGVRR